MDFKEVKKELDSILLEMARKAAEDADKNRDEPEQFNMCVNSVISIRNQLIYN